MTRIVKQISRIAVCLLLILVGYLLTEPDRISYGAVSDYNIVFSNIGNHNGTRQPAVPALRNSTPTIVTKNIDGYALIKLEDLRYLGASITTSGTKWYVTINGQTIVFTEGSKNFTSTVSYMISKPTGGTEAYSHTFRGTAEVAAQTIGGSKYVRLTSAVNQAGAYLASYDSANNRTIIYHFRVNGRMTGYADSNVYVVGGPWLTDWPSKGSVQLSPHFKIAEMRDVSAASQNPGYYYQLKMSVKQLQAAENVRYYYNGNRTMYITSGFRSWYTNRIKGSSPWSRSYHARGRGWDARNTNRIYEDVKNEFNKGGALSDLVIYTSSGSPLYYRTRVADGKSGGHEIETMPSNGSTWLHLQTPPQYNAEY